MVLTCTSLDLSRPIVWSEKTNNISLDPPTFVSSPANAVGTSNLTINNLRAEHNGDYECRVGRTQTTVTIDVPTSSTSTSIIVAAVVSAIAAFAFIASIASIICIIACRLLARSDSQKEVTSAAEVGGEQSGDLLSGKSNAATTNDEKDIELQPNIN